jgi:hypothetical protein
MKKQLVVRLSSKLEVNFHCTEVPVTSTFLDVPPVVSEHNFPILLHFQHGALVSTLHLSQLPDALLLHLDQNLQFQCATYAYHQPKGDFAVQSQCPFVLIIPLPIPFALNDIHSIRSIANTENK